MGWSKRQQLIVKWTLVNAIVLAGVLFWLLSIRETGDKEVIPGERVEGLTSVLSREASGSDNPIRLEEVTADSGIDFHHFPDRRASLLPEDMGSGIAAGDYDNDGLVDLFFVNFAGSIAKPGQDLPDSASCRLYRNRGMMRFEDVTESAGVGISIFGMGAAWGDYDNDGDPDLYVTAYGENVLFRNNGNGTFRDVTAIAGVQDDRFSAGCAWSDYDRDGDLDLYVTNYVGFQFREEDRGAVQRQYATEIPFTLNPSSFPPLPNALFRNRGDGTFEEVAEAAGTHDDQGRSLSAAWVDLDNDGWVDLYVANDVSKNGVFLNQQDGTFRDIGPQSLAADYRGAMGIAVADFDHDQDSDLLITHWIAQENALYINMTHDALMGPEKERGTWFLDSADQFGLGQSSLDEVGWATGFCDLDNDGSWDLWLVNGSTFEKVEDHYRLRPQKAFIFRNQGREFVDIAAMASPVLDKPFVGRGGVQADFDQDGKVDLAFLVHGGKPMIFKNVSQPAGHWLRLDLRQTRGNTYALGAKVIITAGARQYMAVVGCGGSYLSQNEHAIHFGLGDAATVERLHILWPDGAREEHTDLPVDRFLFFSHHADYPVQ